MKTKAKRVWNTSAAMLVLFCLSGCYVVSKNPLPIKSEVDKELLGAWHEASDKNSSSTSSGYMIVAEDQDGWLQVMFMEDYFEKGELNRAVCSEISGEKYLNLKKVNFEKSGQQPEFDDGFTLIHYRIVDKRRLELALLKDEIFKKAVKNRELAGRLSTDGKDLTLTCTSEQLADFLRRHKPEEFLEKPDILDKTNQLPEAAKPVP